MTGWKSLSTNFLKLVKFATSPIGPHPSEAIFKDFTLLFRIKWSLFSLVMVTIGSLIAGIPDPLNRLRLGRMLVLVTLTALSLISMMFLLMVRGNDPLVPRAIFGILNTMLFFPSGAVYPMNAFPPLDASHHRHRSIHLCGTRVQVAYTEKHRTLGHRR